MTDPVTPPETVCISCGGGPILVKKRQLCRACYCRWQRHGDPALGNLRQGTSPEDRFFLSITEDDDCWIWTAGNTTGREICDYGRLYMGKDAPQRLVQAHRWSYEFFIGPIPDELEPDHLCRRTLCTNPWHLDLVPHKINVQRGSRALLKSDGRPSRLSSGVTNMLKTYCPKCGGDYEVSADGKRFCRPCKRATWNEWWMENHGTGEGTGARNREKTHCSKNHEYTPENTYWSPATNGKPSTRDCKICRRDRRNKSAAKMRTLKRAA